MGIEQSPTSFSFPESPFSLYGFGPYSLRES